MHRASREYLIAKIASAPTQVVAVSIDNGVTWPVTCTRLDPERVQFLVAGPSAEPDGALVLPLGDTTVLLRATGTTEAPVRFAGVVNVY